MKRMYAVFMLLILLMNLAACGGKKDDTKTPDNGQNVAPVTENPAVSQKEEQPQAHGKITLEMLLNAPNTPEDQFTYSGTEGDKYCIDSYKGTDKMAVIPAERRNTPITSVFTYALGHGVPVEAVRFNDTIAEIGELVCATNETLRIVVFGAGTQKVAKAAFQMCTALETVVLNEGLQEIGTTAFLGCANLKEITIPSTVTSIDISAFMSCHEDFTIYGTAGSYAETYAAENGIPFVAK